MFEHHPHARGIRRDLRRSACHVFATGLSQAKSNLGLSARSRLDSAQVLSCMLHYIQADRQCHPMRPVIYTFAVAEPSSSIGGAAIPACGESPCETAIAGRASVEHSVRLRIAEVPLGWEVAVEIKDMPAESFEVEVANNDVYILLHDTAPVVLTFPHVIDPSTSSGECGDGILRLSLGKQVRRALGPVILSNE